MTNRDWSFDEDNLARLTDADQVRLINDLSALGYSTPSLAAVAPKTFQFSQLSLILTILYFGYFFILFFVGLTEKTKELPESIHKSVLKRHKASTATAVPAE